MTAGLAGLTEVYTPDACLALNTLGERLRDRLNELFMRSQVRMKATGMGSMINLHPVGGDIRSAEDAQKADKRLKQLLFLDLLDDGIYMAERGFMALSLMVTEADCDRLTAAVERFIAARREFLV